MHRFLRSVGFSNVINRKDVDRLLGMVMDEPDSVKKTQVSENSTFTEIKKDFGHGIGVVLRGDYDEKGFFHIGHYFPYLESSLVAVDSDVVVNKRVDTESYTGMCDDIRIGISLIFYIQNVVDYISHDYKNNTPYKARTFLSGLSVEGKIILGVDMSGDVKEKKEYHNHIKNELIAKAKNGDQDAIDNLTIDEIDMTSKINRRIKNEDLYSLVDTSFIPYGSESDNYMIIGTIVNWSIVKNSFTEEEIFQLLISCNDIIFNVCINKKDLMGYPAIGRRFKGIIWLQGFVDFIQLMQ